MDKTSLSFVETVRESFKNAKRDYLENQERIKKLEKDFNDELTKLKNSINSYDHKLNIIIEKLDSIYKGGPETSPKINPLVSSGTSPNGTSTGFKAENKLLREFKLNRQRIVKTKILEYIKDKKVPVYNMFEQIVQKEGLCSKTSFYRYLKELEYENRVIVTLDLGMRIIKETTP